MKNPNYADSFNDWQSLLKLKTSQVSVAQNRLLKVVISTKRAQSLCRVTPPPPPHGWGWKSFASIQELVCSFIPSHGRSFRPLNTYAFVDPSHEQQYFISLIFFTRVVLKFSLSFSTFLGYALRTFEQIFEISSLMNFFKSKLVIIQAQLFRRWITLSSGQCNRFS